MKKRNITLIIIAILLVLTSTSAIVYFYNRPKQPNKPVVNELDSIKEYSYVLEDRDTKLYKELFKELKKNLESDSVDMAAYATLVSKLYIVDLYTLDNKINQYDVGGLDFVLDEAKENFELKAQDTLYKYIEDKTVGKRTQVLPEVINIESSPVKEEQITVKDNTYDGYSIDLNWEYKIDDGYDASATIQLVKQDNKIYIVKQDALKES